MPEYFEGIITQPLLEKMWKQLLAATEPFYPEVTGRTVRVMQHLHHGGSYSIWPVRAWLLTADGEIPNGARDAIGMCHYSYESALRLSNAFASARGWLPGLLAYVWKGLLDPAVADLTGQLLTTDFFVNGHRIELLNPAIDMSAMRRALVGSLCVHHVEWSDESDCVQRRRRFLDEEAPTPLKLIEDTCARRAKEAVADGRRINGKR